MGKSVHNDVLDGAFNIIKNNCSKQVACSAEPLTYADVASYQLASVAMAAGDFALADGDTSGRKITVAAKNGASVSTSGDASHIALIDETNSRLLFVTTCDPLTLTAGSSTVNFPAWSDEIADPV